MPWCKDTAEAARKKQIEDKKKADDALSEHLDKARHTKELYGYDFRKITAIFKVKKESRKNYPIPTKSNIKPCKLIKKFRYKSNRGRQMMNAALAAVNK